MNKAKTRTPVPRYRNTGGAAILSQGFRPFFLAAALWAIFGLGLSVLMLLGQFEVPGIFSASEWHIHEMIYGYVAAVIVGFLFTAIPNWTGRMPIQGYALLWLAVLWLAGRVGILLSSWLGFWIPAAIDGLFLAVVLAAAAREIITGRNWRNTPILMILALLVVSNAIFYMEANGLVDWGGFGWRLAVGIVITLICLIGGRIIPSFTRNWLAKRRSDGLPASFGPIDRAAIALTAAALVAWAVDPDLLLARGLLGLAALVNLLRLLRWSGHLTLSEPLLAVLHVGYLWIAIGLGLIALGGWAIPLPASAGLHALTIGAIGTMTLSVMSRATLGHTGHALEAGTALTLAFVLITLSAVLRVLAPGLVAFYVPFLIAAAAAWIAAFAIFLFVCGVMLVSPRRAKAEA